MMFKSHKILKVFSNRRADDNESATGRMSLGILTALVLISVLFAAYTLFFSSSKDLRQKDRERRQEQKDSISLESSRIVI